ncbi:MAG: hypothetical protein KGZ79_13715 [Dethiobacter sp.]|jgi:hypothetical protein|nr:hypothetical protein [Dethiobacter sp.]
MSDKNFNMDKDWRAPAIKLGMITLLLASVLSFLPVIYLYLVHGVIPPVSLMLKSWGMIALLFGAFYIVEPVSYYAVLGLAGTYMSFLSGNISNLRLPCAAMALDVTETEPGTKEAEVVSTLGIAGSIITNLIGVTLAAFIGTALIRVFPPVIANAFRTYTVPAIFGAVFGQFAIKYPKLAIVGFAIPVGLRLFTTLPVWVLIAASVLGTIAVAKLIFSRETPASV